MKKITTLLLVICLSTMAAMAQTNLYWNSSYFTPCRGTTNVITPIINTTPGLSPAPAMLNCGVAGQTVRDTIYFTNFSTVSGLAVNSLKFDSIYVPAGLCWSTNKANNTFSGGECGVIYITGTPTCPVGQYKLRIIADIDAGVVLTNLDLEAVAHIRYGLRIRGNNYGCFPYNSTDTISTYLSDTTGGVTGSVTASITASGSTTLCAGDSVRLTANSGSGYIYLWSNGAISQSIVVRTTGNYNVTVADGISSAVSNTVSVAVNTGCNNSVTYWNPTYFTPCQSITNTIVPNPSSTPGFIPIASSLPCSVYGQLTRDTIYFTNYTTSGGLSINSTKFDSIYLPAGLCWSTNKANNTFSAGESGVIYITGTPTCPVGQYKLRMIMDVDAGGIMLTNVDLEAIAHTRYSIRVRSNGYGCFPYNAIDTLNAYLPDTTGATTTGLTASITANGPTSFCSGDSVRLTANSGSGYTYLWSNGSTAQSIGVRAAGSYTVTVSDGISSAISNTVYVTQSTACNGTGYWDPSYFGTCQNATNIITPGTGTTPGFSPAADMLPCSAIGQLTVDTIYFTNYTTFSGLTINSLKFDSIYLPAGLCWSTNKANNTFAGGENGVIFITGVPTGPVGQYKLRMIADFDAGIILTNVDLEQITHMRYGIRVRYNGNSCFPYNSTDTVSIYLPDTTGSSGGPLTASITASGPLTFCDGGYVELTANYDTTYSYYWSNGYTSANTIIMTSGTYTVSVVHNGDTAVAAPVTVVVNPLPTAAFSLVPDASTPHVWTAVNQCVGTNLSYIWSWGDNMPDGTGATPTHNYDTAGLYTICVHITDANGCSSGMCDSNQYLYKDAAQMIQMNVVQYATGIHDAPSDQMVITYYAGAVHFSSAITSPADVRLYDLSGKLITKQSNYTGSTLPVEGDVANGIYILSLQNNITTLTRKLSIVR